MPLVSARPRTSLGGRERETLALAAEPHHALELALRTRGGGALPRRQLVDVVRDDGFREHALATRLKSGHAAPWVAKDSVAASSGSRVGRKRTSARRAPATMLAAPMVNARW